MEDVVFLKCGRVSLGINAKKGCEISSLSFNNIELVHRALDFSAPENGDWYGHGQLLFPSVGRCKDGVYSFPDGAPSRSMPIHGFLMTAPFIETKSGTNDQGVFSTFIHQHNGSENFPFPFILEITFRVSNEGIVTASHKISNACSDERILPFAIGNHITLKYPFEPNVQGASWSEGRLLSTCTHEHLLTSNSLLSGDIQCRPEFQSPTGLPLTIPCATNGVFGFDTRRESDSAGLGACSIMVVQPKGISVEISQTVLPSSESPFDDESLINVLKNRHFVLWGEPPKDGKNIGFICPEPWVSGPDSLNTSKGLVTLKPKQSVTWEFTISVSGPA
jgi:galactose mutarotase-like enzyme